MNKYNNINYHSVTMTEFSKVLEDIDHSEDLFMNQFTFVHTPECSPHFRIEFANILDIHSKICIYVDYPTDLVVNPHEVVNKMDMLLIDLIRYGFRYCYPQFQITKCSTNEYGNSMD